MNTYRVLLPVLVNGEFGQGDEFDYEFTVDEEKTNVESGLLEVVPRKYRVLVDTEVYGVRGSDLDPTFEAAMLIEQESMLTVGGHIQRVEDPPAKRTTKKKED
jgi:hypothetical protein